MFKMLGGAVAAVVLTCAGSAGAVSLLDFENQVVGSAYLYSELPDGGALHVVRPSLPGVIADVGGNKVLALQDGLGPFAANQLQFELPGQRVKIDGLSHILAAKNLSFDVFLPNGGIITSSFGTGSQLVVPASQWFTVDNFRPREIWYGIGIEVQGNGALIDNFHYESFYAPIPEPSTWAMMIAGFGLVGSAMRSANRRRFPLRLSTD